MILLLTDDDILYVCYLVFFVFLYTMRKRGTSEGRLVNLNANQFCEILLYLSIHAHIKPHHTCGGGGGEGPM